MSDQDTLSSKTLEFWKYSYALHGRCGKFMTIQWALDGANAILESVGPQRKVYARTKSLQTGIIMGAKATPKSKRVNADVIQLTPFVEEANRLNLA